MEKKNKWLLTTTLFISRLAACGSQSVLSQADATLKQQQRHLQLQLCRRLLILKQALS